MSFTPPRTLPGTLRRPLFVLLLALTGCVRDCSAQPAPNAGPERSGAPAQGRRPTSPEISADDLRRRVYIFADDSMQGRRAATPGHERSLRYIERELTRLGLTPAGDSGTFFQRVPLSPEANGPVSRNVVALLQGSDSTLRAQYVALGAHSDHEGMRPPVAASSMRPGSEDLIYNGADDDASGSMALLELAEYFAAARVRPKRTLLFVWHTGEEINLNGSEWFVTHPTVPLDSIVVQLNIDMIGRGGAGDVPGGGDDYLAVIGSRRQSSEVGAWVSEVNAALTKPLKLDYSLDSPNHPEALFCRSDHWNYASRGIPVVFFHTGLHRDYHAVTDEPRTLDYRHAARIVSYIGAVVEKVANTNTRPNVDLPRPAPGAVCRQ
ncbi:MAG TPA: M28 family peptidase [Gemmatimonas sp.]|nr:M28 family peptidase [Gemmatimonas sp.]